MSNGIKPDRKRLFQNLMLVLHKLGELRCAYCKIQFNYTNEWTTPTLDHIVPLSIDGSNHISNLVPCCKKCNDAKKSKLWTPVYQNYGFGMQGSYKYNYPLAWQSPYDILRRQQKRLLKRNIYRFFRDLKETVTNLFKRGDSCEQ